MIDERWANIKNYDGFYEISTAGRVKSLPRIIIRTQNGRVIKQMVKERIMSLGGKHYATVSLAKDKKTRTFNVHRLVAQAFIPNPNKLPEVNHKDLNKKNNNVDNLEWTTHSGNKNHAVANGVLFNPKPKAGEDCGTSKLNWKNVKKLREMHQSKFWTQRELARKFQITQANVWMIIHNKTWRSH